MIPRDTFKDIMEKLLKQSRQDKVRWNRLDRGTTYGVSFPESSLTLTYRSPETESDFYQISLLNKEKQFVDAIAIAEPDPLWDLAFDLYDEASRCVTGWDKIVADVVKALDSGERIGWTAPQTVPDLDDDIPF